MRLLLINPRFTENFWSFRFAKRSPAQRIAPLCPDARGCLGILAANLGFVSSAASNAQIELDRLARGHRPGSSRWPG
jgi:hypothetical protein